MDQAERIKQSLKEWLILRIKLYRAPIGLMSILTSLAGYAAYTGKISLTSIVVSISVGFISTGALIANNIQDRYLDRIMIRTQNRPIPLQRITLAEAAAESFIFVAAGCVALTMASGTIRGAIMAMAAIVLYNIIYTPLKKISVYAIIPGVISGSLPIYIGWVSAMGPLLSVEIIILTIIVAMWQLPHAWIINLANTGDFDKALLPSMARNLTSKALRRLVFLWTSAFAVISMSVPLIKITMTVISKIIITVNAFTLITVFLYVIIISKEEDKYRFLFNFLNISICILFLVIILERMLLF